MYVSMSPFPLTSTREGCSRPSSAPTSCRVVADIWMQPGVGRGAYKGKGWSVRAKVGQ